MLKPPPLPPQLPVKESSFGLLMKDDQGHMLLKLPDGSFRGPLSWTQVQAFHTLAEAPAFPS